MRLFVIIFTAFMMLFVITQTGCEDCDVEPDATITTDARGRDAETCFRPNGGECIIDASPSDGGSDAEVF